MNSSVDKVEDENAKRPDKEDTAFRHTGDILSEDKNGAFTHFDFY